MSVSTSISHALFLPLILNLGFASAHPFLLSKRSTGLTRGGTAGLAIGIVVAGVLVVVVAVFLILHLRSKARTTPTDRTHGVPLHEKNPSMATTISNANITPRPHEVWVTADGKQVSQSTSSPPRRKKSLKDHLMGPLYQESQDELAAMPLPAHIRRSRVIKGADTSVDQVEKSDQQLDEEFLEAGGSGQRDTVQSFSSRRATRLMMMM